MKSIHWKYQRRMLMSDEEDFNETEVQTNQKRIVNEAFASLISELRKFEQLCNEDNLKSPINLGNLINELEKLESDWTKYLK